MSEPNPRIDRYYSCGCSSDAVRHRANCKTWDRDREPNPRIQQYFPDYDYDRGPHMTPSENGEWVLYDDVAALVAAAPEAADHSTHNWNCVIRPSECPTIAAAPEVQVCATCGGTFTNSFERDELHHHRQEQPRKREFTPDGCAHCKHERSAHRYPDIDGGFTVCGHTACPCYRFKEPERDAQEQPRRFTEWEKAAISYALTSMGPGFLMDPKLSTTHGEMRRVLQAMLAESAPEASESSEATK